DTEFALSAIPLGGYVEIAGMQEVGQGSQEEATRSDAHAFSSKPYYQKLLIMLGGIMVNLAFSYTALALLFAFLGMPATPLLSPRTATATVASIIPQSPAEQAGIKAGDILVALNQQPLSSDKGMEHFFEFLKAHAGESVLITVQRDTVLHNIPVTLAPRD